MRKATLTTGERADHADQLKKLTKHVSECVRRANSVLGEAGAVGTLFTAQAVGARARLRDACQKVITMAPGTQARRMEEILWRKVYYEPLASAKKMRKGTVWATNEAFWVYNHLWSGVAYYHQLLQSQAQSSLLHTHQADLLPYPSEEDITRDMDNDDSIVDSLHRYLTCLGDLTRYMLDLTSPPPHTLSVRYYLQALHYNPESGLTHSNLATVYSTNDQPLLAVAHYLRALTCEKTFEGAESNLKRLLDKSRTIYESGVEVREVDSSPTYHHKMFLHTFLTLISLLINNRETEDVARLCQDVLVQLGKVLETYDDNDNEVSESSPIPGSSPNGHIQTTTCNGRDSPEETLVKKVVPFSLTSESIVIVCAVLCLCTHRLKKKGLSHTSMAQALFVSVLLTLVSHVSSRLEQRISLVDPSFLMRIFPETEKEKDAEDKSEDIKELQSDDKGNCKSLSENSSDGKKKPKNKRSNRLANLRRRRRVNGDGSSVSDDESDFEGSGSDEENDKCDDDDDDVASVTTEEDDDEEEELDFSQLCSSEDDDDSDEDVKIVSDQWDGLTAGEHLQLIGQEGMLSAVFVACNWLKSEDEVIHLCIKTADSLWTAIAKLLNLLRVDLENFKDLEGIRNEVVDLVQLMNGNQNGDSSAMLDSLKHTPLAEDLMLHTLIPLYYPNTQNSLNLKSSEMVLMRVERLCQFGRDMSRRSDTPLWCSVDTGEYRFSMEGVVISENIKNKESDPEMTSRESTASPSEEDLLSVPTPKKESKRLAGMQSLTAQWLQHEVRNLEERTARRATLGLYLVPDATVLINHLTAIKMLLSKPTHMIIIPQTVIDLLDQQKRESVGARDAIRWLEIKFRHGSRFIRAQRPHERTHLPLIKYPKRKDKEAWEWYQILECCHYLSAQVQQNSSVKSATVTLLTAINQSPSTSFSHSGLALAAGAVMENIEEFIRKWQTSTKGHS
ncbi:hypothetical protein SK128_016704 [Halocaridina rubra]|uniref:PIN domain-containing protein n=1 Tax=Halocaridina rubra TaxID=373956 RepID=A0AAN9A410_HALRR